MIDLGFRQLRRFPIPPPNLNCYFIHFLTLRFLKLFSFCCNDFDSIFSRSLPFSLSHFFTYNYSVKEEEWDIKLLFSGSFLSDFPTVDWFWKGLRILNFLTVSTGYHSVPWHSMDISSFLFLSSCRKIFLKTA